MSEQERNHKIHWTHHSTQYCQLRRHFSSVHDWITCSSKYLSPPRDLIGWISKQLLNFVLLLVCEFQSVTVGLAKSVDKLTLVSLKHLIVVRKCSIYISHSLFFFFKNYKVYQVIFEITISSFPFKKYKNSENIAIEFYAIFQIRYNNYEGREWLSIKY